MASTFLHFRTFSFPPHSGDTSCGVQTRGRHRCDATARRRETAVRVVTPERGEKWTRCLVDGETSCKEFRKKLSTPLTILLPRRSVCRADFRSASLWNHADFTGVEDPASGFTFRRSHGVNCILLRRLVPARARCTWVFFENAGTVEAMESSRRVREVESTFDLGPHLAQRVTKTSLTRTEVLSQSVVQTSNEPQKYATHL